MKSPFRANRREFLKAAGIGTFAILGTPARSYAANDKVHLGVIGCGGMGSRHIEALAENPNCTVSAVCDVAISRHMAQKDVVANISGTAPDTYQDFRNLLDRPDIDAIFVVTPDHWHPLLTILGCKAGKDVYVEKPVSPTVVEGRAMVETARRYGRVVQVGTQQRSMPVFQKAIELVHSGRLGQITSATAWVGVNEWNVGTETKEVPKGLDWDLWLGPAPYEPFSQQRFGGFMGWHDYARGGQLTNWGVHLMDILHWGIKQDTPFNVQAMGNSFRKAAGSDNYEVIEAMLEYPGCNVTWEQRHSNIYANKGYGIRFHGTEGQLAVDRGSFVVTPDALGIKEWVGEPEKSWANPDHHNNFFRCIRTREKPAADIEQGFRSTTAVLLAGIALKTQRKLEWDGKNEQFIRDEQANRYLARAYRAPWHL